MAMIYELREVDNYDYNGLANVGFLHFTSGVESAFGPAGHSDKSFIGKTVLCELKEADGGYQFVGLAEVLELSPDGRPTKFGRTISNQSIGYWQPPKETDEIFDKRESKKS